MVVQLLHISHWHVPVLQFFQTAIAVRLMFRFALVFISFACMYLSKLMYHCTMYSFIIFLNAFAEADMGSAGALAKKKAEAEAARLVQEEQQRQAAERQAKKLKYANTGVMRCYNCMCITWTHGFIA